MRKYLAVTKFNMLRQLEQRVNNFIWFLVGLVPGIVSYIALTTVYGDKEMINGFAHKDLFSYYVVMSILWYLIGGTFSTNVGRMIKDGTINISLTKPFHAIGQFIFWEQGWKIASFVIITPVAIFLFLAFDLSVPIQTFSQLVYLIFAIILGAVIFSFWDMIIGMSAFFIQNMTPIDRLNRFFYIILSGQMVPLSLLPVVVTKINDLFFYRYTFGFPLDIMFSPDSLSFQRMFAIQFLWVIIMFFLFNLVFKLGIKHYEAVGA